MTKATLKPYDRCESTPSESSRIAALEAQLAQRDNRIRKLREELRNTDCDCSADYEGPGAPHCVTCNLAKAQARLAADRLLADAKEGEGE